MRSTMLWFRRDLRLGDHPALLAAAGDGSEVVPLFVLDDRLRGPSGAPRLAFLYCCLRDLDDRLGGRLVVLEGDPATVVPRVAADVDATAVHVSADFGPYGMQRDDAVATALGAAGRSLERVGSPYAVAPGRVRKPDGTAFRVFTPFSRAWRAHGWRGPAETARNVRWTDGGLRGVRIPSDPALDGTSLPEAGESAALRRWEWFRDGPLTDYAATRDRPGVDATSRMSVYLKYGCIHPRTLLAGMAGRSGKGPEAFRNELAWREFYADVLHQRPDSAREYLRPEYAGMPYVDGPAAREPFEAWTQGRTGFPMVDAGMRQLLAEGWMHNRLRMLTASFLVKDLHQEWQRGARWFLSRLVDGDLASNNHGWQWVAGSGTDAAPYFRVFNPVTQGRKFDPDGAYVRRWVPELRDVDDEHVHEPWTLPDGLPVGYPDRIVDHAAERKEALRRYELVRS